MTWAIPVGLRGNAEIIRLSASLLDRREGDCRRFAAVKARPQMHADRFERTRYAPWEDFPLGIVMRALDAVEFGAVDPDEATTVAIEENRSPVHPGVAAWIRHAVHGYLRASAQLVAQGLELVPERNPRVVQHVTSAMEARILTAWGRWYASADGSVREFRRIRLRRPRGAPDAPATLAMAFITATGHRAAGNVYGDIPISVRADDGPSERVRLVEIGITDGVAKVLVDASPEKVRQAYLDRGRGAATRLQDGSGAMPGKDCAQCKAHASCDALPHLPGLLGLSDRGTHRRTWSVTVGRQYRICPAQAHLRSLYVPGDETDSSAVRRGVNTHEWLRAAHSRFPSRPCTADDLPAPGGADLGIAGALEMDREDYREIRPYLLRHLDVCPLRERGQVTELAAEPKLAVFDPDADVVVIANPDLLRRVDGLTVYREQKTSYLLRTLRPADALEQVPQIALAVCLIADGAFGDRAGRVELERLSPEASEVIAFDAADPATVVAARRVVTGLVREWHRDTEFVTRPSDKCGVCPVARWCTDAAIVDGPTILVDGVLIDRRTGEVLAAPDGISPAAEGLVTEINEPAHDDEPPY
jgi:hypothetical protein